jgi:two-component system response regulator NreC
VLADQRPRLPPILIVSKSILIVDDSAVIRSGLRSFLTVVPGFEICGEGADGVEALEKAVELKPDLILLDLSMPRMNGLEAAAELHKIMPRVPVLLFTLHAENVISRRARDAGIASIVSKTDQMHRLPEGLESIRILLIRVWIILQYREADLPLWGAQPQV